MKENLIQREKLLTVNLDDKQELSKVEITKVTLPPSGTADYHLHPCPVVGYVVSGELLFQIEGEEKQILNMGKAFYEPKDKPILHFDNASDSEPLVFLAYYLLEDNEEMIKILPKK